MRFVFVLALGSCGLVPRAARACATCNCGDPTLTATGVEKPYKNRVRYEAFKHLGYFVTESSEHFAEYVPWFIKRDRPELIEEFNIPLDEYIRRCQAQITAWHTMRIWAPSAASREMYSPLSFLSTWI